MLIPSLVERSDRTPGQADIPVCGSVSIFIGNVCRDLFGLHFLELDLEA